MNETFYLSNILPQNYENNAGKKWDSQTQKIIYGPFLPYHVNCWLNLYNLLFDEIHKDQNNFSIIRKNYFATIFHLIQKHIPDLMNSEKKCNPLVNYFIRRAREIILIIFCVCQSYLMSNTVLQFIWSVRCGVLNVLKSFSFYHNNTNYNVLVF